MTKEQRKQLDELLNDLETRLCEDLEYGSGLNSIEAGGLTLTLVSRSSNVGGTWREINVTGGDWNGILSEGICSSAESGSYAHGDFNSWRSGISIEDALTIIEHVDEIDEQIQERDNARAKRIDAILS